MKKIKKKQLYIITANILALGLLATCNTINNNPVEKKLTLQNVQVNTAKPVTIKKFVNETDEIKAIEFYTSKNIHLKKRNNKIIVLKSYQIKGIPSKITSEQIQTFLTKNAWIKIQKNTDNTYALTAHLKNYGGMKSLKQRFENLSLTSYQLSAQQKYTLEALATIYNCQIMVIEDNKGEKKIGLWGESDTKITLAFNGDYFKNYQKNVTTIDFVNKKYCSKALSLFYCVYKAKKNKIHHKEIEALQKKVEEKIKKNNTKLFEKKNQPQSKSIAMTLDFGSSKKLRKKPVLSSRKNRNKNRIKEKKIEKLEIFVEKTRKDYPQVKTESYKALDIYLKIINGLDQLKVEKKYSNKHSISQNVSIIFATNFKILKTLFKKYPTIENEYIKHKSLKTLNYDINANVNILKEKATEYFKNIYGSNINFEFIQKEEGVQTGSKMIITNEYNNTYTYFIKTHQHGSRSTRKSTTTLDPKEIFIYKLLEQLKIGPQVEFFYNSHSKGGFYIATRDAGEKIQKKFFTYKKYKDEKKDLQKIIEPVALTDIFARIFCLQDVTTNDGNFGFVEHENSIDTKIIDFEVKSSASYQTNGIFDGFKSGNGLFNYSNDKFLIETLQKREVNQRIKTAHNVINKYLTQDKLTKAIDKAKKCVKQYQEYVNDTNKYNDLDNYINAIKINLTNFTKGLEEASKKNISLKNEEN